MSSPQSAGKRKRTTTLPTSAKNASAVANTENPPATSDHPTSGLDPTLSSRAANVPKQDNVASSGTPAAKRQRSTNSEKTLDNGSGDPAEGNESNEEISARVQKSISGTVDDAEEEKMAPPPIGKLTHPVGYTTNDPPAGRAVRVYADGVFDLFHLGHMRQLEQAKKAFPDVYLLVGVTGDKETHMRKGLTVLSGQERAETVRHCKWVDEVIENCPWIVTPEFLAEHKIDYVAHDDLPYGADEGDDIYKPIKEQGKFLVTQRTEGVSTTGIITKIVRDYEKYIARQFKRGTSRQELNVSWLKKNELDLKRHVTEMRDAIRTNWSTTGQELGKEIKQFWQASRPGSPARQHSYDDGTNKDGSLRSPSALSHLSSRLEIPNRATSPGPGIADFATGYSLGLIGGVRSWMTKSRQTADQNGSDSDSNDEKSPIRGRTGKADDKLAVPGQNPQKMSESNERAVDAQVKALLNENSKASGA